MSNFESLLIVTKAGDVFEYDGLAGVYQMYINNSALEVTVAGVLHSRTPWHEISYLEVTP
jgi:hypothetical protein